MKRILLLVLSFFGTLPTAFAVPFTVSTTADVITAGPCGECFLGLPGCSLRCAIIAANVTPGLDDVIVPADPNPYLLTIRGTNEDACFSGDLDILDPVNIRGGGIGQTVVDASGLFDPMNPLDPNSFDRVFNPIAGAFGPGVLQVTFENLTIQNGNATTSFVNNLFLGGGIFFLLAPGNMDLHSLTLNDVVVQDNVAFLGGGIASLAAVVTLNQGQILNNQAVLDPLGGNGIGGGILLPAFGAGPGLNILNINGTQILNNSAAGSGGGVVVEEGTVQLTQVNLASNMSAGELGGLGVENGTLNITGSTISGNSATGDAGGIAIETGTLNLVDSTVSGNSAGSNAGGMAVGDGTLIISGSQVSGNSAGAAGGGLVLQLGTLTITQSTISNNQAALQGGGIAMLSGFATIDMSTISNNQTPGDGGGLVLGGAGLTLSFSTVSENSAGNSAGGLGAAGDTTADILNTTFSGNSAGTLAGGIGISDTAMVTLTNSTLSGNTSGDSAGAVGVDTGGSFISNSSTIYQNSAVTVGGGVAFSGNFQLQNTILAGNVAPNGADCFFNFFTGAPVITSGGYNLIGQVTNCSYPENVPGDQVGQEFLPLDPALNPLADNGGPTQTHALQSRSVAINGGNPAGCTDEVSLLTTDQRGPGFPRVAGINESGVAVCDIGAFESQANTFVSGGGISCQLESGDAPRWPAWFLLLPFFLFLAVRRRA